MNIVSNIKLRPFSHKPGTKVVIPGSDQIIQAYPTLIQLPGKEIALTPAKGFTVMLDLERCSVIVYNQKERHEFRGEKKAVSRLCFGAHKKQEWDAIVARRNLSEVLPILFAAAQMSPLEWEPNSGGMFDVESLLDLLDAGFSGILTPRLFDNEYQGIAATRSPDVSPFALFPEVAKRIHHLFISDDLAILPNLPPELHAGKLLNVRVGSLTLDIEWSKKMIRRMLVLGVESKEITPLFQSGIKSFRVRCWDRDRGIRAEANQPLQIEKGKTYFLDRFEK